MKITIDLTTIIVALILALIIGSLVSNWKDIENKKFDLEINKFNLESKKVNFEIIKGIHFICKSHQGKYITATGILNCK